MQKAGSTKVDTSVLNIKIYMVELELKKLQMYELHKLEERILAQRKELKDACIDLIEVLLVIINELEKQEEI